MYFYEIKCKSEYSNNRYLFLRTFIPIRKFADLDTDIIPMRFKSYIYCYCLEPVKITAMGRFRYFYHKYFKKHFLNGKKVNWKKPKYF